MRPGRRFTLSLDLPVDPWPRASLGERMSIGLALALLLLLPFCAAGALCLVVGAAILHAARSYDVGAGLRALIDRRAGKRASARPGVRP